MQKLLHIYDALFNFWVRFPETMRYLLVGGYNTAVFYFLYVLFVLYHGENYAQPCLFAAFVFSSFHSFFTQRTFVFLSDGNYKKEYMKCFMTWGVGYFMNAALLKFFTDVLGVNVYLSEFLVLIIVTCFTYFLLKYFAFGKDKK